jgi:hypothetical protein
MDQNRAVQALVGTLTDLTSRQIPKDPWIEVGQIRDDYALVILNSVQSLDGLPIAYPPERYVIARHLCVGVTYLSTTPDGSTAADDAAAPTTLTTPAMAGGHTHGGGGHGGHVSGDGSHSHAGDGLHAHLVLTPVALEPPKPGDLVEVHWANGFTDPIVAAVLVAGTSLTSARGAGFAAPGATPGAPATGGGGWLWDAANERWYQE